MFVSNLVPFWVKGVLLQHTLSLVARLTRGNLPPLPAVAAIIEQENQLLLIERSDSLGFCLPGGIMRWGETTNSALQREVKEETGYAIEILRLLHNYSGPSRDPRISAVCMTYSARCVGGELSASPEGIPTWIPFNEVFCLNFAFDHYDVIRDYFTHKLFTNCSTFRKSDCDCESEVQNVCYR